MLEPGSSGGHNRSRLTQCIGLQQVGSAAGVGAPSEPRTGRPGGGQRESETQRGAPPNRTPRHHQHPPTHPGTPRHQPWPRAGFHPSSFYSSLPFQTLCPPTPKSDFLEINWEFNAGAGGCKGTFFICIYFYFILFFACVSALLDFIWTSLEIIGVCQSLFFFFF